VGKSTQPPVAPVEVVIKADQSLLIRDRAAKSGVERGVSQAELVAALTAIKQRNPEQAVVISADKDVRYEAVLKVMDELQRQNFKVGLMVKPAAR